MHRVVCYAATGLIGVLIYTSYKNNSKIAKLEQMINHLYQENAARKIDINELELINETLDFPPGETIQNICSEICDKICADVMDAHNEDEHSE